MQVQHKQAIVVLQKVLIVTIFITISAMSAHATTLIGKDIRDILSKIESQAFLNTIYFCKSDSDYFGIPKENIRAEYDFSGGTLNRSKSYKALFVYSKNSVNKGTNYVDEIYFVPKDLKEGEVPYKVDGIASVTAKDGSQSIGFHVSGKRFDEDYGTLEFDDGIIIPEQEMAKKFLYLITNNENNPYCYSFVNGRDILSNYNQFTANGFLSYADLPQR